MAKEHGQMRSRVSQRSAQQNALLPFPSPRRSLHVVQIVVSHGLKLRIVVRGDQAEGSGTQVWSQVREEEE